MTENAAPKPITLRLPAHLDRAVRHAAESDHRSLNSELIVLLELGMTSAQRPADWPPVTVDEARGLVPMIDHDAPTTGRGLAGLIPPTD